MCLEYLTILELVGLLPVSKLFHAVAGKLIRHRANCALQRWTGNADGFRALLRVWRSLTVTHGSDYYVEALCSGIRSLVALYAP